MVNKDRHLKTPDGSLLFVIASLDESVRRYAEVRRSFGNLSTRTRLAFMIRYKRSLAYMHTDAPMKLCKDRGRYTVASLGLDVHSCVVQKVLWNYVKWHSRDVEDNV